MNRKPKKVKYSDNTARVYRKSGKYGTKNNCAYSLSDPEYDDYDEFENKKYRRKKNKKDKSGTNFNIDE